MPDRFSHLRHHSVLYGAIALGILGFLLLYAKTRHNSRYTWQPVKIPLQLKAGEMAGGSFVADLDEPHEIEIQFQRPVPLEALNRFVKPMDKPSPLDIRWPVSKADKTVAQGTCRDYLYIASDYGTLGDRFVRKVARIIHNRPYQPTGTFARGVGKFDCSAGDRYNLHVEVGTTVAELNSTNPTFGVKINRLFETRYKLETKAIAVVGIVALGLSLFSFCWWEVTTRLRNDD
jgi:hypothetical protein